VPVTVITLTSPPPLDLSDWDHITECSLAVPTGEVVIAGSTDYLPTAKRVSVAPGVYRVRVSYGGLSTISDDGFDGDDRYRVQLWPQAASPLAVLKDRAAGWAAHAGSITSPW
jgi:hypothetical protein